MFQSIKQAFLDFVQESCHAAGFCPEGEAKVLHLRVSGSTLHAEVQYGDHLVAVHVGLGFGSKGHLVRVSTEPDDGRQVHLDDLQAEIIKKFSTIVVGCFEEVRMDLDRNEGGAPLDWFGITEPGEILAMAKAEILRD